MSINAVAHYLPRDPHPATLEGVGVRWNGKRRRRTWLYRRWRRVVAELIDADPHVVHGEARSVCNTSLGEKPLIVRQLRHALQDDSGRIRPRRRTKLVSLTGRACVTARGSPTFDKRYAIRGRRNSDVTAPVRLNTLQQLRRLAGWDKQRKHKQKSRL